MTRQMLVLLPCLALTACIPTLTGAPCSDDVHCPSTQRCNLESNKCELGARVGGGEGGGGGGETGGGTATGGGATGGGATGGGGGGEVDAGSDTEAPVVIATTPTTDSTGVSVATSLVIVFSEPMDVASVGYLTDPNVTYGAPVWTNGNTALRLTPTAPLAFNRLHRVGVLGRDTAGNAMTQYNYTFTTEATADVTPPVLSGSMPSAGETDVATNANVVLTFSEPMNPASVVLNTMPTVTFGNTTWGDNNTELSVTPTVALATTTTYDISVSGADVAGNALASGTSVSFTTAATQDTTPPLLTASTPDAGSADVAVDTRLSLTFNEPMNVNVLDVTVDPDPGLGVATWTNNNTVVTWSAPTSDWPEAQNVTVEVTGSDAVGNALAPVQFSFDTAVPVDMTPPTVTSTAPANMSSGVPPNASIEINFSKPMNEASVQAAFSSVPAVTCTSYTWNTERTLMVCGHTAPLATSTNYVVTIGTGATDASSRPLAAAHIFSFGTAAAMDNVRPSVTVFTPRQGALGVPRGVMRLFPLSTVSTPIQVTFSEEMSQSTVQGAFSISPAAARNGTFTWNRNTMTYTPPTVLPNGQVVTWQLTNSATDLAGNSLMNPINATFTIVRRATAKFYGPTSIIDGYIYANAACTSATVVTPGISSVYAGDRYISGVQTMYRGYLTFSLAPLASLGNVEIISAALYVQQSGCSTPSPYTATFGNAIQARHISYGPALEVGDCNAPVLTSPGTFTISNDAVPEFKTAVVTSAVRDDFANRTTRGNRSQYMLRTATLAGDNDTASDYCYFSSAKHTTEASRPYLNITYEYD